jgi:hypothetical protein
MGSVKNKDKRIMIMKSSAKERVGGMCLNDFSMLFREKKRKFGVAKRAERSKTCYYQLAKPFKWSVHYLLVLMIKGFVQFPTVDFSIWNSWKFFEEKYFFGMMIFRRINDR